MKAKKAVKRLNKAEALLSGVIDQFPAGKQELGELLASARAAIIRARETVNSQLPAPPAKGTAAGRAAAQQAHATANGMQKAPVAAAKRRTRAEPKGMNVVTGRRLKKTA